MLRWLTAGESHGPSLTAILEGLPAHVRITSDDISDALARRDRTLLKRSFPFGPFMVFGTLVGLVWGTPLAVRMWG